MPRTTVAAALAAALLWTTAPSARSDADFEVANGDRVTGTLRPATEIDVLRVRLPQDAALTVAAKGLKPKGAKGRGVTPPAVTFRVLDGADTDIAAGAVTPKGSTGATVRKLRIPATGEYRVEVRGDGANAGDFQVTVQWKSPTKVARDLDLSGGEVPIGLGADAGATLTLVAKPARGSAALPRLLRLEHVGDDAVVPVPQPDASARTHKARRIALDAGGDYRLIVGDAGGGGGAKVSVTVTPPKAGRRKIQVTDAQVGTGSGGDRVVGAVVGAAGGTVIVPADDPLGLGGASLTVPPGSVGLPTALLIGSAPAIATGPAADLRGAGPTVFFGPEGQKFSGAVTVTIPFNAAAFEGDFSTLVVVERDAQGRTSVVPKPYTVNAAEGTLSFPATHFTAYRAFGKLAHVPSDLNDDGRPDLVYLDADGAVGQPNRVRVVLGGPGFVSRAIDERDVLFQGTTENDFFGQAIAVGDVNGDGIDDLLIGAQEAASTEGRVFIFFGGAAFKGSIDTEADADVVLRGAGGLARLGTAIALGQFVGDATADVAVGTNNSSPFSSPEVFVFEGGAALVTGAAPVARISGPANQAFASRVVAADVSGDGSDDLVVGSAFTPGDELGAVYVFFGGASFGNRAHTDADVTLSGAAVGERFGSYLAVGDVVGDGAADLVVGTFRFGSNAETVYVFRGGTGLTSGTSASADVVLQGDGVVTSDFFGSALAVANVGGDAKADVIVGDRFLANVSQHPGGVAVFFGGPGLASGGIGNADVVILGENDLDFFGGAVAAQDLDRDGLADIVATAPLAPLPSSLKGKLYLFDGGSLPSAAGLADVVFFGLNFGD